MPSSRLLLVAAGGAAGAGLRWAVFEAWPDAGGRAALLAVNLVGSFLLGAALALPAEAVDRWHAALHDGIGTGFCGGLTTFSTLAVEVAALGRDGRGALGAGYLAATVVLGLLAVLAGARVAGGAGGVAELDEPLEGER